MTVLRAIKCSVDQCNEFFVTPEPTAECVTYTCREHTRHPAAERPDDYPNKWPESQHIKLEEEL